MALLYLISGITIIKSDEVAVVLRWGKLVGATPALQAHGPGLLFAFPRPMDQVVRVQVKRVREISVDTLTGAAGGGDDDDAVPTSAATLNPLTQGYALTGDQNIVHLAMVARYRVRDRAEWAFYGAKSDDALRVEVTAAMVRSLGEMGVDRVYRRPQIPDRNSDEARAGRTGRDPRRSGALLAGTYASRPAASSGGELRCRAERIYRSRNVEEAGPGLRRGGDPAGSGRD